MSREIQKFLDASLPLPGVVACAVRLPDQSIVSRRDGDALTSAHVEQLMHRIILGMDGFKRHRLEPHTVRWTFDRACIHVSRRADGAVMAVICGRQPGHSSDAAAEGLLVAFQTLASA